MRSLTTKPGTRMRVLVLAVLLAATSACGTTTTAPSKQASGNDAAGVAAARAEIAKFSQLQTSFPEPGPALTTAQAAQARGGLSGKTVWFIPIFQQAIQFKAEISAFTEAMALSGASVHVCDAEANPSTGNQCLLQAVSSKAGAIVTSAIGYSFAKQGFDQAIAAKIPLVLADADQEGADALPASPSARQLSVSSAGFGTLSANWIINDSGGAAHVLLVQDDAASGIIQSAAAQAVYSDQCPRCEVTMAHYNDGAVSKLTTAVSAALLAHPDISYVQSAYDEPGGIYAVQGVKQVRGRTVKFLAGGGSPVGLQRIKSGQQSASPGVDTSRIAWDMADAVMRFTAGTPQVKDYPPTLRLFTADNLPQDPSDATGFESGSWYSNGGYRDMYRKLWGAAA